MANRNHTKVSRGLVEGVLFILFAIAVAILLTVGRAPGYDQGRYSSDKTQVPSPMSHVNVGENQQSVELEIGNPAIAAEPKVAAKPTGVVPPPSQSAPSPPVPTPAITVTTYISKEVLVATVGSGPGQIGIQYYRSSPPDGPQSFDVDERGNIYILDQANKRVNKYDANGKFVSSFSFPESVAPMGIAVWKDGTVFLADERDQTVKKYDESGRLLLAYNTAPGTSESGKVEFQADGVRIDRAGNVYAIGMGGLGQLVAAEVGTVQAAHSRDAMSDKVKPDTALKEGRISGRFVREDKTLSAYIEMTRPTGQKQVLRINIGQLPVAGHPLEATPDGAVYLHTITQIVPGRDGYNTWVVKFDKSGTLVGAALFPREFYTSTRRSAVVDEMGRIYYMQVLKDSIHVFRWETR